MTIKDMVFSSMMAGLIAVMALFPPIALLLSPTPITLQSLGVMLAGSLLGAKRGAIALLLFLLLLALGFPVLAGLLGGAGLFLTSFGGFLLAWPLVAFVIGWLTERSWARLNYPRMFVIHLIGGAGVMYLIGVPWMAWFAKITLTQSMYFSLTLLPGDLLKIVIATWVAMTFKKYHPLIEFRENALQY